MNEKQQKIYDVLTDLGSNELLDVLLNYTGLQLLNNGLYDHLIDEGLIDEEETEEDEEE